MYNIIVVITALIIPFILIRKDINKSDNKSIKKFIKNNQYSLIVYMILFIGIMVRLIAIDSYPAGLNQDEASSGYEAYSLAKYGVDRHLKTIPVNFISWGSGQNVLYSYIAIPFIQLFGLSVLSLRLSMAIIGCISLILVYRLFKTYNKKIGIIAIAFFAICPWHIMKSRWALESNLFPDLVLIAIYMIISGIKNEKTYKFYIGIVILSLSAYAYGTAYMFLPIFMVMMFIYLLRTKKITIKTAIISFLITLIIVLPLMLFIIINSNNLDEIKIGFITIPRLKENRYESVTTLFSSDFLKNAISNFTYNIKIILNQYDKLEYNGIEFFGIIYTFSLPFTVIGMFKSLADKKLENKILNFWFISAFLLLFVMSNNANINRLNIFMIPMILYSIIGIYEAINGNKNLIVPIIALYSISFVCFTNSYMKTQGKEKSWFTQNVEEPIKYADSLNVDKIYITYDFTQPYIYTLFYTKSDPNEFNNTVKYYYKDIAFEMIQSYGKYYFYIPQNMDEENVAYIVPNGYDYDTTKFEEKIFDKYTVIYNLD